MSSGDDERVAVRTTVPSFQKDEWERHAEDLGMSMAEYARSMIQAGRRGFDLGNGAGSETGAEAHDSGSNPWGRAFEDRVLGILDDEGPMAWDELVAALNEDLEARLEGRLNELRDEGIVQHSPRDGTYSVTDDGR
jgi:hypothetical protein